MEKVSRTKGPKIVLLIIVLLSGNKVFAGPPLPTHSVEGNSGVFITSTAYLANPAEEDTVFGKPSTSGTFVWMDQGEKDFESIVVTENLWGNVELGYALERIGLGDWPDAVRDATGGTVHVDNYVLMYNFNTRLMVVKEGSYDLAWMPAVTLGAHFKWNDGLDDIDFQTGGLCGLLGADHDSGTEFTAVATKTIGDWLPRPLILTAGVRNGDAIHTGLLGFAGERKTTFEGSFIYFLSDKLLLASEYRQKSNLLEECTLGGEHLIKEENDWWDIALAYVFSDCLTVAGGYADFGNVLNHRENNSWAIQVKYEF